MQKDKAELEVMRMTKENIQYYIRLQWFPYTILLSLKTASFLRESILYIIVGPAQQCAGLSLSKKVTYGWPFSRKRGENMV